MRIPDFSKFALFWYKIDDFGQTINFRKYSIKTGNMWDQRSLLMCYTWFWHHLFNYFHRLVYKISLCAIRLGHGPSKKLAVFWWFWMKIIYKELVTLIFLARVAKALNLVFFRMFHFPKFLSIFKELSFFISTILNQF